MGEFRMPSLGADMDSGTLVEWRVAVGDHVRRGDTVAVVDTDKSTIDVEVFETGVVVELLVEPGATVPVGAPLARIGEPEGAVPATDAAEPTRSGVATVPTTERSAPPRPTPSAPPERPANSPTTPVVGGPGRHRASLVLSPVVRHLAERLGVDAGRIEGTGPGRRITRHDVEAAARERVSPRARRLAEDRGVDLDGLRTRGSGPGGAVVARDVAAAAAAAGPATATGPTLSGSAAARATPRQATPQQAMARTMERSNREIPHFHVASTVDLEPAMTWLDELNRARASGERILPAALLVRSVALAARAVPSVNGWWRDDEPALAPSVTVGMVVSLRGGGLLTPTLSDADQGTLDDLMTRLRAVVERARRGSLRSSDTEQASLTITNLGDRGAELVHGVIQPPQLALVGFGRIVERPWVHDGQVVPRRVVTASLAADHRANDGRSASRFLSQLEKRLADPASLAGEPRVGDQDLDPPNPGGDEDGT